ncbi:hypothetical protein BDZ89DRAFT_1066955 [Hymenopellis radicata]|nr:hypothetical protein BDZ89DRAFT_1066955 [Hymenopellis radicata]
MSSETNVPDTTQTDTGDVEPRATNQLTPPSKTDGFTSQTSPSYSNASIPMPGDWAQYPAVLNWTIQVYAYKTDLKSKACIIMVHSGNIQSIVAEVRLTHKITSVNNGASGSFVNHLPRTNDGQQDGQNYRYTIDFNENLNLVDKNSNPFEYNAVFRDEYTRSGFIQNGDYAGNEVVFSLRKAPLGREPGEPRAFTQQIHGLSEFKCDLKSSGTYDFTLSFDAGSTAVTKNITVSL